MRWLLYALVAPFFISAMIVGVRHYKNAKAEDRKKAAEKPDAGIQILNHNKKPPK